FEPLRPDFDAKISRASHVAAWSAQAGDKTQLDRVTPGREYDRNRRGRRFGRQRRRCGSRGDDGDLLLNQIGRQRWQSVIVVFRPAILDGRVLTVDVAGFLQTLAERGHHWHVAVRRCAVENRNHRHSRLLGARTPHLDGEQQPDSTDQGSELTPRHVGHGPYLPTRTDHQQPTDLMYAQPALEAEARSLGQT